MAMACLAEMTPAAGEGTVVDTAAAEASGIDEYKAKPAAITKIAIMACACCVSLINIVLILIY